MDNGVMTDLQGVIRRLPHAEKVTAAECLDFDSELMTQNLSGGAIIDIVQGKRTDDI